MKEIATALIQAQKEMSNAKKDSKNPFFKSSYADLNSIREACIPHLNNNGIAVLQPTVFIEGKSFIKTILLHESGESIEGFSEIIASKSNDAQSHGSGTTYARRYGLQSMICIGAEDDDGNLASKQPTVQDQEREAERYKADVICKIQACKDEQQVKLVYDTIPDSWKAVFNEVTNNHLNNLKTK